MLSIAKLAAGQESYYLELGREDYYLEGGEPLGFWEGRGARDLGLDGPVRKDHLQALIAGRHPRDGSPLGQQQEYTDGRRRQPGWDLSFSVPKSVSALWSVAPDDLGASIQEAVRNAAREAVGYVEEAAGITRRGEGGKTIEPAKLVFALFEHGTSRAMDPQLHVHALCLNLGHRLDGTWGAIRSEDLYRHKMAAGAIFRVALAEGLQRLGLRLQAEKTWFEVEGVPAEVREEFSKRRAELQELKARHGVTSAKGAEALVVRSRHRKGHVARRELLPRWRTAAAALGFGVEQASALFQAHRQAPEQTLPRSEIAEAVRDLADTRSSFHERDLVRRVAERAQTSGVSASDLLDGVRRYLATDSEITPITVAQDGFPLYTTSELARAEKEMLEIAERLHGEDSHSVDPMHAEGAIALCSHLNDEQREAVRRLTGPGRLSLLSGMAGTGKTTALLAAREAWESAGFTVLGAALSGRAAAELHAGAGIKSSTIDSLLYRVEPSLRRTLGHHARMLLREAAGKPTWKQPRLRLDRRTVLVIDEAAMVGTAHLARILRAVDRAGGKAVLVGDAEQLQSIGAGGGFKALVDRHGAAELRLIKRQQAEWMRNAVREFAAGDSLDALIRYAQEDRLHVEPTRGEAVRTLLEAWQAERTTDISDTLIIAGTNREVEELNHCAQEARRVRRELGAAVPFRDGYLHEGDRVMFLVNVKKHGVLNGDLATIERVRRGILDIRLDRMALTDKGLQPVRLSLRPKDLEVRSFGEKRDLLRLGYACTAHKAQGATVDRAFVLAGGWMQDRELSYVQMSRARQHCRIFTDEVTAGEDLAQFVWQTTRSRQKELAHTELLGLSQ